ncbi:MAG TPA: trehalose-phosphatase [Rhizomicrobium sp.]
MHDLANAEPPQPGIGSFVTTEDAFLLDVDGTILDIAPTPEDVRVPDSLKRTLAQLQKSTEGALSLVSGRTLVTLDALFAPLALTVIGCHGAEWRIQPDREIELRSQPLSLDIKRRLLSAISDLPQIRIEDKDYTFAIHYRRAPELGPELQARLADALKSHASELRLLQGKFVFEVHQRSFDKGEAVGALMQHAPFRNRRPVFLGDDTTDQDAFTVVTNLGGIGISVGQPMIDAAYMFPNPQAARDWLAAIAAPA